MITLGIALTCLMAVVAQGADPRVGIGGVYRTGSWTPLVVEYGEQDSPAVEVSAWVEDPDGQFVRSPPVPVVAEEDGVRRARLQVRFGRPSGRVRVEEVSRSSSVTRSWILEPPLPAAETVILVLGDLPAADRAARLLSREDGSRPRVVAIDPQNAAAGAGGLAALGRTARDFDGIDAIVASGRAVARLQPAVLRGIDEWVRLGGQLVLVAGSSTAEIAADGGLSAWLPGRIEKLVPLRRSAALEAFARASRPLDKGALAGAAVPLFVDPADLPGVVEAFDGRGPAELPLVVRRAYGLGTVAWAAADLDAAPFRDWSGSDTLLVELLRGRRAARDTGRFGEVAPGGLDLAGQLRQAIDGFPGVKPIPFEVIAGLGALYVACLYPLDWWLVAGGRRRGREERARRSDRQFLLAWLSLPLLVAGASWVIWSTGQRWKGNAWRASGAELIDVDAADGTVRRLAVAGIWSPANATLDVSIRPAGALEPGAAPARRDEAGAAGSAVVSWFASCGRGIGGTDAAAPHPSLAAVDYGYRDGPARLDGVPIAASSSRLFEAEVTGSTGARVVASSLAMESQGTLKGTLRSALPFALEGCVLAYAGWLYDVGSLRPGESFEPAQGRGPRSLAGALTRRTVSKDRDVAERWNPAEQDPLRILEIAGLHGAAGGRGYTDLDAGRLGRFDLSPLLGLDRAVLVGRGPAAVSWTLSPRIAADGTAAAVPAMPTGVTVWRIVIPLARTPAGSVSGAARPE